MVANIEAIVAIVKKAKCAARHSRRIGLSLTAVAVRHGLLDGCPPTAGAEGSIIVEKVRESKDKNYGYNALTDEYEDLVAAGVIDPTKVTRTALQNAASIAGLLLTTECVVVERKEEKASAPSAPGAGMGGMY